MMQRSSPSPRTRRSIARSPSTGRSRPGEVQAAASAREDAGGKGINVARVVAAAGVETVAVLPLAVDDPFDCGAARFATSPRAARRGRRARARERHDHRSRPASPRSSTCPARRSTPADVERAHRRGRRRERGRAAGSCSPDRCRPAPAHDFYVDVIARGPRDAGAPTPRASPSTRPAPRCARSSTRPHPTSSSRTTRSSPSSPASSSRRAPISPPRCCRVARALVPEPRRRGARDARRRTAPCSSTPTARGRPRRRGSASSAPSAPATARSPATCSPTSTATTPAERLRRSVRYGAAAASLPGTQAPTPHDLPAGEVVVRRLHDRHPHRPQTLAPPDHWRSSCPRPSRQSWCQLDVGLGADKAAVIRALAARVVAQGRATDADALFADAWAREQKDETGLPGGIAIPHAKSAAVTEPSLAFARLQPGVDFGAPDGPADLVFLIAAPEGAAEAHLAVLSKLARSLMQDDFTARPARRHDAPTRSSRSCATRSARGMPQPAAAAAGRGRRCRAAPHRRRRRAQRRRAARAHRRGHRVRHGHRPHVHGGRRAHRRRARRSGIDLVVEPQGSSGYQALPQQRRSTTPTR